MNIKEKRIEAELTQAQLAEKVGVNQSTVAAWESGAKYPRAQILPMIAFVLGCTVNDLYPAADHGEEVSEYAEAAEG